MRVVLERCCNDLRLLFVPNKTLKAEGFFRSNKVPTRCPFSLPKAHIDAEQLDFMTWFAFLPLQIFVESSDSADHQVAFTNSLLWKLLDRHGNTIRLLVLLPEQSPGTLTNRSLSQKEGADSDVSLEGSKGNRKYVEAILEESTEKLKNLSLQQQQQLQGSGDSGPKISDATDLEHIESPTQEPDSNSSLCTATDNRDLENRIRAGAGEGSGASSDPENHFACEERSDSEVNNDRSTSSVDSDILSSSHSSDTLCNADSGPMQLANGLDSHSITSSRRSKAHEGKKETWDTAEEDSGTDSEYDDNGKAKGDAQYLYFRAEPHSHDDASGDAQKCKNPPALSSTSFSLSFFFFLNWTHLKWM